MIKKKRPKSNLEKNLEKLIFFIKIQTAYFRHTYFILFDFVQLLEIFNQILFWLDNIETG